MRLPVRLGWLPDLPKAPGETPDHDAGPILRAAPTPPRAASNRRLVVDVLDQGHASSCVANAILQAVRASHVAQGVAHPQLGSRLFSYYVSRAYHHDTGDDTGTYLRTCFQGLAKFGFCPEDRWPYHPDKYDRMPPAAAFRAAYDQADPPPTEYRRIVSAGPARVDEVKRALAGGFLVCFGTQVSVPFCEGRLDTVVDPPAGQQIAGGHALACAGYEGDVFDIVNSWGTDWGDRGWCQFSADYIAHPTTTDLWVITRAPHYSEAP